jgi:manganese/iron transport system substrate-binding protein
MNRISYPASLAVALVALALAACGQGGNSPSPATRVNVVTTSTVFADMAREVGGDLVEVTSLVPNHGDVHTFEPAPADLRKLSDARLVVRNGLGLDDWLIEVITSAAPADVKVLVLADGLQGVELLPGEEPGEQNPHLWMAVPYAMLYVDRIEAALAELDPANAARYASQADAYQATLVQLDGQIRSRMAALPAANRRIVTFHDALPYFAREYGIEVVGVAVEAPGQDPSADQIAELIDAIRASGVKAIFSEDQFPTQLVDQLASETSAVVVADLYTDSLGDPPIDSYEALMTWDVDKMVEALD